MNRFALAQKASPGLALSVVLLACLTACGGGSSSSDPTAQPAATPETPASTTTNADSSIASALETTSAQPAYHMAPVLLDEPDQSDVGGTNASAHQAPKSFRVEGDLANIDTARLTRQALSQRIAETSKARIASASGETAPQATAIIGAVHTPAQIRAAYGLPAYPPAGTTITPAMAATFGAGQTIYIVDAYHDATALSDLNTFSTKFGLPTCANVAIPATAILPLAAPPASCTFSAVSPTTTGTMTTTVPAYNTTWAPESKLDVQWAHAIAPLARIVLLEMPSSLSTAILGANMLAVKMGPGVVSMSFGSTEAAWAPSIDYHFTGNGMTFVAAAGDSGSEVLWPAVSPNVVAVGGTSLNWSGSGTRYEAAWKQTGGGLSAYEALPSWQSGVTPAGGGALPRRAVPDVSFNGDPYTGEYVALTLPGAPTVWTGYGGTSIAAPQWAAMIAVANAMRASSGKATLGDIHSTLYKSIAAVPGTYAASLGDVVDGTNGTCATCRAGTGFDEATGWGTPNAAQLLQALSGVSTTQTSAPVTASPVVPGGSFTGKAGTALSQSLGVTAPSGTSTTYAVSGAPGGLTVDSTGTLKWAAPVAGSYTFTATASTAAGKSASASYSLKVIAATAPAFSSSGKFNGTAGTAFSGTLSASNPNGGTLNYSLAGVPAGLTASTTGALSWASPVAGSYTFTATVKDSYGYSSTQTETLTVAAPAVVVTNHAPTLAPVHWNTKAGTAFSTMVTGHDPDGGALSYTATGAPAGFNLMVSGFVYYPKAVKGSYAITVTVRDSKGAATSAVMTLTVS
ncbi:putative Ig domain-containing protein [Scleromatobacter humisilvae]|uniref:Ig domain-containing protein n=1 Tax=Scleromatobacter humisilvae TaxID=2897159 RepID=A0A9X2BYZ3_9BURK|nr:putative Ig domain-containing protein [Scleromatobacter humisilvae]MCK9685817.1 putative Ig domain-containing protein [Scleromatobacter humisilvae]